MRQGTGNSSVLLLHWPGLVCWCESTACLSQEQRPSCVVSRFTVPDRNRFRWRRETRVWPQWVVLAGVRRRAPHPSTGAWPGVRRPGTPGHPPLVAPAPAEKQPVFLTGLDLNSNALRSSHQEGRTRRALGRIKPSPAPFLDSWGRSSARISSRARAMSKFRRSNPGLGVQCRRPQGDPQTGRLCRVTKSQCTIWIGSVFDSPIVRQTRLMNYQLSQHLFLSGY